MKKGFNQFQIYSLCEISFGLVILLVLFVLGSLYDQEIANWFLPHQKNNFFGLFFDFFGYGIYTIPLAVILLMERNFWKVHRPRLLTKTKEGMGIVFFLSIFAFLDSLGLFQKDWPFAWITWFINLCVYFYLYSFIIWYFYQPFHLDLIKTGKDHYQGFLAMLIYMLGIYLTALIFKVVFARPRILTIEAHSTVYQPWWAISWSHYSFKNNSFPSAHVEITLSLLSLLYLLKPQKQSYFYLANAVWFLVIVMACARMIYNAHYLTDTLMAMIISIPWFYFGKWVNQQKWLVKKQKKQKAKTKTAI